MIYGYARISTDKQKIERQEVNILSIYPSAKIFREIFTGTKFQGRKELNRLLSMVNENDTIVFDSVSRMSRDAVEGFNLYEKLFRKGINLVFLKEPHINTDVYRDAMKKQISVNLDTGNAATDELMKKIIDALNTYVLQLAKEQIRIAFDQAEKEVKDLHVRTSEGIARAKAHGKQIGRLKGKKVITQKSIKAKEVIKKYNKSFGGALPNEETRRLVGISVNSFYKYKKEIEQELLKEFE